MRAARSGWTMKVVVVPSLVGDLYGLLDHAV